MHKIAKINFIIGCLALLLGHLYCLFNSSGHSGIDPIRNGSFYFMLVFMVGLITSVASKFKSIFACLSLVIGISGFAFGFFIHNLRIMQNYEYWAKKGLHEQNPIALWLLLIYFGSTLIVLLLTSILFSKFNSST